MVQPQACPRLAFLSEQSVLSVRKQQSLQGKAPSHPTPTVTLHRALQVLNESSRTFSENSKTIASRADIASIGTAAPSNVASDKDRL